MNDLASRLLRPIDGATLALFRIVFAVVMFVDVVVMWYCLVPSWEAERLEFRPVYSFTPFLAGWSAPHPNLVCPVMLVALLGLALGFRTRLSAFAFAAVYSYVEVLDPTRFNNHAYLIALAGFGLGIVRSAAVYSIDARLRKGSPLIPYWHQGIFVFQWCVVYIYGGLAKLNGDWLRGEPVVRWVNLSGEHALLGPLLGEEWVGWFVGYFGIVFDLTIWFFLVWRRTRPWAMLVTAMFHLTNSQLFNIGVFPWMGIGSLVIFLRPDAPRRWFGGEVDEPTVVGARDATAMGVRSRLALTAVGLYCIAQLLIPFRHFLYSGWVEWNAVGKPFSWRMMLSHNKIFVGMQVVDRRTGMAFEVDQHGTYLPEIGEKPGRSLLYRVRGKPVMVPARLLLQRRQLRGKGVWGSPLLLVQYARYVAREARELGIHDPLVRVDAVMSLNGRPYQYFVDPDVDLASAEVPLVGTPDWVVPLKPNQPIGDYPEDIQEFHDRVMAVILDHHERRAGRSATTATARTNESNEGAGS